VSFSGIVTLIWLPDTPMSAAFLSEREKVVVLEHVSENQPEWSRPVQLGQPWELS